MAALLALLSVSPASAVVYTYTEATSTTTAWSSGTSWDAVPVGAADTVLVFTNSAALAAGTSIVSDNDTAGNFQLNRLNFLYPGPSAGAAPALRLTGNPLEFTGASAQIYYSPTGAASGSRPLLVVSNDIVLATNLTVYGTATGPTPMVNLAGAVSGDYRVQFQGTSGQHTSYMLSNPGNSYTGDTRIYYDSSSGRDTILWLGASDVVPNGVGFGNLYLMAPGEAGRVYVRLNGMDETVNGLVSTFPAGAGGPAAVHAVQNGATTAATLTLGDADATATYYGTLQNAGTGALHLSKIGTGTQTLAGVGTHTGTTTISGGTLLIDYDQLGISRTATPTNYYSPSSGIILGGGATFALRGRRDGGAYYQESYTSPAYNRTLNLPNASVATFVVGQPVTLTQIGGTGVLGAAGDSYYIQAFGTPGATTTPVHMNARVVSSGGVIVTVDIPATVAATTQYLASLTLSGASGSNATLDLGTSDNVVLTVNAAPVQTNDGSTLTIANWSGDMENGGAAERLLFVGEPADFASVFGQDEVIFDGIGPGYRILDGSGTYEVVPKATDPTTVLTVR